LWRGFWQITRTTRLRRTILQWRHILFTDAMTFMLVSFQSRRKGAMAQKRRTDPYFIV